MQINKRLEELITDVALVHVLEEVRSYDSLEVRLHVLEH